MPGVGSSEEEYRRRLEKIEQMSIPSGYMGYGAGHGARLRGERRAHAKEMAELLAESGMAEIERAEVGATRRAGMKETGLGERLGREQEFARPAQRAEIRRVGALGGLREAEAEKVRYGTEFERGTRGIFEDILESRKRLRETEAEEAGLGLSEIERKLRLRDEAEAEAEAEAARPSISEMEVPAKPGREMRPGLKKFLWGGWPERGLPGLGAPVKGYLDIAELLGRGARKGYEWAFPRGR